MVSCNSQSTRAVVHCEVFHMNTLKVAWLIVLSKPLLSTYKAALRSKKSASFVMMLKSREASRILSQRILSSKTIAMYDDAELDTTFSERACQIWVHPTAHSSGSSTLRPRLKRVRDGRRETLALVLTEELEKKIQTALALGRGHIHAVQDVKRWKHETRLKQADNKGSMESFTHRFNAKCAEIQPNKEPTEFQKKTLKMLAQSVERTKANQGIMDETIANYDRDLARGLNRWRKAWADIDKILAKVWTDAGRLVPDDDSDADNERPPRATESKNEAGRNGGRVNIPGDNLPLAAPEVEPARQRQAGRRRSDISEWQNSVEAHSPTNLDKGKDASTHRRQAIGRTNNAGDRPTSSRPSRHSSEHRRRSYRAYQSRPPPPPPPPRHGHDVSMPSHARQQAHDRDAHRERRDRSRSSSPGRERGTPRDAPEYRERNHRESQQQRTRDESARRIRSRNPPEDGGRGCGR